jgi:hypothetical protein
LWPGRRLSGWIPDQAGIIAHDQHDLVSEVLKLFEFADPDSVPNMNVRRGRIESLFYAKGAIIGYRIAKFRPKFFFGEHVHGPTGDYPPLCVNLLVYVTAHVYSDYLP